MDPKRVVRVHAAITAAILIALALLGHALTGLILSSLVLGAGIVLAALYWRAARRKALSPKRVATDRYARQCWLYGGGAPFLVSLGLLVEGAAVYRGFSGLTEAIGLVAGITFVIVVVSGLIDWYLIVPRIAGEVCPPPCRSTADPRWKRVTRLWYIHRGVAALTVSLSGFAVIPLILSRFVDANTVAVVVTVVGAVAVVYIRGLDSTVHNVLHPSFYVGDLVEYLMPGRKVQGYLVDVAVEGVKIKETHRGTYTGTPFFPDKHTFKIHTSELGELGKSEIPFHGCDEQCCGVNWYCRENPKAY